MFRILFLISVIYLLNKGYNFYRFQNKVRAEALEEVKVLRGLEFSEELIYKMMHTTDKKSYTYFKAKDYPVRIVKRFFVDSGENYSNVNFNTCYGHADMVLKQWLIYCPVGEYPMTFAIMDGEVVHSISY